MTAERSPKKPAAAKPQNAQPDSTPFSAADFPALRTFLRGYFHQDLKDEYGTPAEAVREFCEDASAEERAAVAENWSRFLAQAGGQPLEELNRILTGALGSSYALTSENVGQISAILSRATRKAKR